MEPRPRDQVPKEDESSHNRSTIINFSYDGLCIPQPLQSVNDEHGGTTGSGKVRNDPFVALSALNDDGIGDLLANSGVDEKETMLSCWM